MTKIFASTIILAAIFANPAQAITRATFPGVIGMITINSTILGKTVDNDADQLYQAMRVPPIDSVMGPGKTIKREDHSFSFICAQRPNDPTCTIIVKTGASGVTVNPLQHMIALDVNGAEAAQYHELFYLNSGTAFRFQNTEGNITIVSSPEHFSFQYQE